MNRLRDFLTGFATMDCRVCLPELVYLLAFTTNAFVYIRVSKKIWRKPLI